MKVVELIKRHKDDPFALVMHESYKLTSFTIDNDNILCGRFNDTRTPYEQYCAGERYLKYDDETLYSRAAHEYMFDERERRY